jgi:hypothetical protein
MDRAETLRATVADPPDGQRHAVELYYADVAAGQFDGSPGAAKANLHKARQRLLVHITAITGTRDWTAALGLSAAPFHEPFHANGGKQAMVVTKRSDQRPPERRHNFVVLFNRIVE